MTRTRDYSGLNSLPVLARRDRSRDAHPHSTKSCAEGNRKVVGGNPRLVRTVRVILPSEPLRKEAEDQTGTRAHESSREGSGPSSLCARARDLYLKARNGAGRDRQILTGAPPGTRDSLQCKRICCLGSKNGGELRMRKLGRPHT